MFVISVSPGNLIQREVQANMNSGGKVELDMHAPPTIRKMWIPAGGILLNLPLKTYPLKLQALGKVIFYRHIAHVTQKVEKLCF